MEKLDEVTVFFYVLVLACTALGGIIIITEHKENIHIAEMATKAGLEQCLRGNKILWQRSCTGGK